MKSERYAALDFKWFLKYTYYYKNHLRLALDGFRLNSGTQAATQMDALVFKSPGGETL